jgi:microcin C transport system ATP-binding protein
MTSLASPSPARRAWQRFKRNRLGHWSLLAFGLLVALSLMAELVSNDRPLLVRHQGQWYTPLWVDYPETTFGGDFPTPTDYLDPFIQQQLSQPGSWALFAPNRYGAKTLNYFAQQPNPAPPSADNWLGTDDRGRDLLAQLIYGFRVSVLFALALTATGVALGVLTGAVQGYFGGKTDLAFQRFMEIWGSMPELYLLIIFSAVLAPSVTLLLVLLSLFGWMGLSDYVRAEFLRNRQMDYVRAARAMGVGHWHIITRHILPNSLTPVVTFLPFRMSAAILALTSLDFLGLGVPPGTPSLGELLSQGKNNIDAWWISLGTFGVLVVTLLLLTFMGDALRDALDPRKASEADADPAVAPEPTPPPPMAVAPTPAPAAAGDPHRPAPLLQVHQLGIAFGAQTVVHGLSLALHEGERLALVGESGSGKTLTALALLGLVPGGTVTGQVLLNGRSLLGLSEREWQTVRGGDVAMVFQEPMTALNPLMTVGEQIAEVIQQKSALPLDASVQHAMNLLASVGLPDPAQQARAYPHQLSGGQRQRVLIAMALAGNPKLLLADEPTTALDVSLRGQVLELLATQQKQRGMALLLITHDLQLVRQYADRVAVMERGVLVEQGPVAQVFAQPQHPYTRKLLDSRPERDPQAPPVCAEGEGVTVLRGQGVSVAYPVRRPGWRAGWGHTFQDVLQPTDFALVAGQTLAVVGESGSGKSTLALAALNLLSGVARVTGQVRLDDQPWSIAALPLRRQRQRVQVVFQDPFSSLSPRMTIEHIVGEGLALHHPGLDASQRRWRVAQALAEVGLLPPLAQVPNGAAPGALPPAAQALLQRYPHQFSGGQRQRLAIARALVVDPAVLVLDEPTSALDVTVQKQVLTLLQRLQRERGLSYLLITHDMAVVQAMAHRVMVLQAGRVVESGTVQDVFERPQQPYSQRLIAAALGG